MLKDLFKFEWYYYTRKPLTYVISAVFFTISLFIGLSHGMSFPNVHINSPYQVTYLLGVLSLGCIFSLTLLAGLSILRETDHRFDQIIYATAVPKWKYLLTKVVGLGGFGILTFLPAVAGLFIGHQLNDLPGDKFGAGSMASYLWPAFVIVLPNILLSTAILSAAAWLSRNKLVIYVSGLFIFILYIAGSIFSNSPLIAGSATPDPGSVSLFAKVDPFGMAAFFEQTRYWTAIERNHSLIGINGNLLFNRAIWLACSLLIIFLSYWKFNFRQLGSPANRKWEDISKPTPYVSRVISKTISDTTSLSYYFSSMFSLLRIHINWIIRGIPFILISMIWVCLLGLEMKNAIDGDSRSGPSFATSGLLISTIIQTLPVFALLVILFYSSELVWKTSVTQFAAIENSTPLSPLVSFLSKGAALGVIVIILLGYSVAVAISIQLFKGTEIESGLYFSLLYFVGLPLFISGLLATSIQILVKNMYLGLTIAGIVIMILSGPLGPMIGLSHPILGIARPLKLAYHDMNGFSGYVIPFTWHIIYSTAFVAVFFLAILSFRFGIRARGFTAVFISIFLASGMYTYYYTDIFQPRLKGRALNDWKQAYELKYGTFKNLSQPTVTDINTRIDLYPQKQNYSVEGTYNLENRTDKPIDSLLIIIKGETRLKALKFLREGRTISDTKFGHKWYILKKPLLPGEKMLMNFAFTSGWTGFQGHTPFNSIIKNGTFIRISNYYPDFGYAYGNELSNSVERRSRGMHAQDPLAKLEHKPSGKYDYKFINLSTIISTDPDQTAIGQGQLIRKERIRNRNYFSYRTDRPMPFRFAVSSAKYRVVKDKYRNIPIEIFFDERHRDNAANLLEQAKRTLSYCEKNFSPYAHRVIRFAEVSSFAEGFAATAYPTTIYMKENGGFNQDLKSNPNLDVINQLAGHELSHEWWGSALLSAEIKEGGWVMSETLAKYTELMLLKNANGEAVLKEKVSENLDLYLSMRSFSKEMPLYKTTYETPHIPYYKGLVVMYQLFQLIGEKKINAALASLLTKHKYPEQPADTEDLIRELYAVSTPYAQRKIDELFKEITVYNLKLTRAIATKQKNSFLINVEAIAKKFQEDGLGVQKQIKMTDRVEILVLTENRHEKLFQFPIKDGKLKAEIIIKEKPVKMILDPRKLFINLSSAHSELDLRY